MSIYSTAGYLAAPYINNTRFQNNIAQGEGAAMYLSFPSFPETGQYNVQVFNSYFINNTVTSFPGAEFGGTVMLFSPAVATFMNNSFYYSQDLSDIYCESGTQVNQSFNTYCGIGGRNISCSDWVLPTSLSYPDYCGVCNGNNQTLDCQGICFGGHVIGKNNGCCYPYQLDCNGVCFGDSVLDEFNTCCVPPLTVDCAGKCNGTSTYDNSSSPVCCPESSQVCGLCNATSSCCPACLNNGICEDETQTCNCTGGYFGESCSLFNCDSVFSCNGGTCIGPDLCNCTGTSKFGPSCSDVQCGNFTCDNNSTCILTNSTCDCSSGFPGFSGPTCSNFSCSIPCENSGVCVGPNLCDCSQSFGYFGPQCANFSCSSCENGGICSSPNTCSCAQGFSGPTCNIASKNTSSSSSSFPYWAIIIIVVGAALIILIIVISIICKKKSSEKFF